MKQCRITYKKRKNPRNPHLKKNQREVRTCAKKRESVDAARERVVPPFFTSQQGAKQRRGY